MNTGSGYNKNQGPNSASGGSNTTREGRSFEALTDNEIKLMDNGYQKTVTKEGTKFGYFLFKKYPGEKKVLFTKQDGLNFLMRTRYNITGIFRKPDEAYIVEHTDGSKELIIIEKKSQKQPGSVDIKLLAGPILREEYQLVLGDAFQVKYIFSVSSFLKNKILSEAFSSTILRQLLKNHSIPTLYGDDPDYFERLNDLIKVIDKVKPKNSL